MTGETGDIVQSTREFLEQDPPPSPSMIRAMARQLEQAAAKNAEALALIYRHTPERDGPGPCSIMREIAG